MALETISTQKIYDVFAIITDKGERNEEGHYSYKGLVAESYNDGYSVVIRDQKVSVTLGFHNAQQHQFEKSEDFNIFVSKLEKLIS